MPSSPPTPTPEAAGSEPSEPSEEPPSAAALAQSRMPSPAPAPPPSAPKKKHTPFQPGAPLIVGQLSSASTAKEDCGQWPLVYIIGVQKAATTSLAVALEWQAHLASLERQRSDCCDREGWGHCSQEARWFQDRTGRLDYSRFPYLFDAGRPAYDATPEQLTDPAQPSLLHNVMPPPLQPRAKFIVILREPASRMLSWYNHRVAQDMHDVVEHGRHCAFCQFCDSRRYEARRIGQLVERGAQGDKVYSPTFDEDALCELDKVGAERGGWAGWNRTRADEWYAEPAEVVDGGMSGMHGLGYKVGSIPPLHIMRGMLYAAALARWRAHWARSQMLVYR